MPELAEQLRLHAEWVERRWGEPDATTGAITSPAVDPDHHRSAEGDDAPVVLGRDHRLAQRLRPRLVLWSVAALLVAVALTAGMLTRIAGDNDRPPILPAERVTQISADSALAPSWVPDGYALGAVDWSAAEVGPFDRTGTQLLARTGSDAPVAEIAILTDVPPAFQNWDNAGAPARLGTPVTIRGVEGHLLLAADATVEVSTPEWMGPEHDPSADDTLTWFEGDAMVTLRFKDLSTDDAIALADGLTRRAASMRDGFDVAPGGPFVALLGPQAARPPSHAVQAWFIYVLEPGDSNTIEVSTCARGFVGCSDAYAHAWFEGTRLDDGSVLDVGLAGRSVSVSWPEGGYIEVTATGTDVDQEDLEQIVAGVQLTDQAGLVARHDEVASRSASLPLLAAADLPSGRVELHGVQVRPLALCLRAPAGVSCNTPSSGHTPMSGVVLDGTWYLLGADVSDFGIQVTADAPPNQPIPLEHAYADGHQLVVAKVPAGVDAITISVATQTYAAVRPSPAGG